MSTNTITRHSLADEVAAKLQAKILKGSYKIDQKLPNEAQLMKAYGVGRSTIREAVKILVNSGFLRVQQGLGTFIDDNTGINEPLFQRLKRADTKDIDEVRRILEMKVAEKAAVNRTGNDISKLEYFLGKKDKAAEENLVEECIEAHINFYLVLAEAAKNDILTELYKLLAMQLKSDLLAASNDTSAFQDPLKYHQSLLDGVLRQDSKKAWYFSAKINNHLT